MFVCTAMARPRPSITWYRVEKDNSRTVLTGAEEGVTVTTGNGDTERTRNSTLTFNPSRPFFSAVYICEATNVVASTETNATLMVYGELEYACKSLDFNFPFTHQCHRWFQMSWTTQ